MPPSKVSARFRPVSALGAASIGGFYAGGPVCGVPSEVPKACPERQHVPIAGIHWEMPEQGSTELPLGTALADGAVQAEVLLVPHSAKMIAYRPAMLAT
jgi:hypothetical protein